METIFVTGTSGYIGGTVAARLVQAGYRVRGLVRTAQAAQQLRAQQIEPVMGTLEDAELLAREASNCDGIIDAASADHAASAAVLVAGLKGTSKPLLHTSGASVVGDDAHGDHATDAIFNDDSVLAVHPAKQARRDIDLAVLASAGQGVRSAVICPGLIYGVGRGLKKSSYQIPFLASNARRQGVVQLVGPGRNIWSTVHIDDLADLYLLALRGAPPGAFYFAESGEVSFAKIGAALSARLGIAAVEPLNADVAAQMWGEAKAWFSLASNSRVRAVRARAELGWQPRHASLVDWITGEMPDGDVNVSVNES